MQRKPFAARPIGEFVKEDEAVVVDVDVRKLGVDLCRRDDHAKPLQDHHTATELIEGEPAVRGRVELCKGAIQLEVTLESAQQREELAALDIVAGRAVGLAVCLPLPKICLIKVLPTRLLGRLSHGVSHESGL